MAYDVSPTSERWEEIVNIQDENKQGRELRKYVYELENKVSSYEYELRELRRENTNMKKDILINGYSTLSTLEESYDCIESSPEEEYLNTILFYMQNGIFSIK